VPIATDTTRTRLYSRRSVLCRLKDILARAITPCWMPRADQVDRAEQRQFLPEWPGVDGYGT